MTATGRVGRALARTPVTTGFLRLLRFLRTPTGPRRTGFLRLLRLLRLLRNPTDWPAPLPEAAFHGLAGDIVRVIEPHTEADSAAILLSLLAAVGNALGRGPFARAEGDTHGTNLYVAIVGETSKGRKGTSWSRVREVVAMAFEDWTPRIAGGLSSGEGLIWAVRDPILTRRRAKSKDERERADDDGYVTEIEDEGITDHRLLIIEGELAQPLRAMRREANTLSPTLRNLWDRADAATMTKNSPARTTGALVSLIAHIVSDELRRELTATDSANGFANRFLWVCARRSKLLPDGGNLQPADLQPLANRLVAVGSWAQSPRELSRNAQATALWHEVYGPLSAGRPGLLGAVTSRAEAQVLRLSLIYAALDRSEVIALEHLQAALAVWDYCARSAAHIFGDRLGDPVADKIRDALAARQDAGMTRLEIVNLFGRHESSDRIEGALKLLERCGLIVRLRVATGGRPTEVIRLRECEESCEEREESPL